MRVYAQNYREISRRRRWKGQIAPFFALLLWGCEEPLPPRNDPEQILRASLNGITHEVVFDSMSVQRGGVAFCVAVDNLYDEPLQADGLISGSLEVDFMTGTPLHAEVPFDVHSLESAWILRSGIVTIGVDSAAIINPRWSHEIPSGTPVWQYLAMHQRISPRGDVYYQSDSIHVIVQGSVQIFKNVQPIRLAPLRWTFIYTVYRIPPPPITNVYPLCKEQNPRGLLLAK